MINFTQISNNVIRNPLLTPYEKVVLGVIQSFSPSFPSYSIIAKYSGMSVSKAKEVVKELVRQNVLVYIKGKSRVGKWNNEYSIKPSSEWRLAPLNTKNRKFDRKKSTPLNQMKPGDGIQSTQSYNNTNTYNNTNNNQSSINTYKELESYKDSNSNNINTNKSIDSNIDINKVVSNELPEDDIKTDKILDIIFEIKRLKIHTNKSYDFFRQEVLNDNLGIEFEKVAFLMRYQLNADDIDLLPYECIFNEVKLGAA